MNISILGCGWLGLPLAKKLIEAGHVVKGSTTTLEKMAKLREEGITPYQIKLFTDGVQGDLEAFLSDAEVLIIDIPPGIRNNPDADFVGKIGKLKGYLEKSPVEKVLFISSTSVYEDREDFPVYTEEKEPNGTGENSRQLIAAEKILRSSDKFNTTIIRFGGLIGPGRHPVNFLSQRKDNKNAVSPVNLIHLEDCLGIIESVVEKDIWGETINAVHPDHPPKEIYYTRVAEEKNLALPGFDLNHPSMGKVVDSVKVKDLFNYNFQKEI